MSQQQQNSPPWYPQAAPKPRRGMGIVIIAGAVLIAVALIVTVVLLTSTPASPTASPPAPTPTPSVESTRVDESNAPTDVNGWTIGDDSGSLGVIYLPPGSGQHSDSFITVHSDSTEHSVRSSWSKYLSNPSEEANGRATCGVETVSPKNKTCLLDTETFGFVAIWTWHEAISYETVVTFTENLAAKLP